MDGKVFQRECESLIGATKYKRGAKREEAPDWTDCLTSVSHIFKKTAGLSFQLDWIGNMPRRLHEKGWEIKKISPDDLKAGDLIFLGKKGKLVTHLALAWNSKEVFHVARKGAKVESLEKLLLNYQAPQDLKSLLSYVDFRTKKEHF